jgi:hypothetical protein
MNDPVVHWPDTRSSRYPNKGLIRSCYSARSLTKLIQAELLKANPQLEKVSVSNPASPRVHQHDLARTPGYLSSKETNQNQLGKNHV